MQINFNSRDPVYVQVVRHFKRQIAMGFLEPGEQIPSRRDLASMLKINPNTVQRAYKEMEDEGLIKTESNQPSRITNDPSMIKAVRDELIQESVHQFVSSMRSINVPLEEALELIKQNYALADKKEDSHDRSS